VHFFASGHAAEYYNDAYDYFDATLVTAVSAATTSGINAALSTGGSIAGTVTDHLSGLPIAGADVSANREECCGDGNATTAADGSYLITGLAPGDYRVLVSRSGYAPEYHNDAYDQGAATLVEVLPAVISDEVDVALQIEGRIAGTVYDDATQLHIAGVSVYAERDPCCGISGFATTAGDGSYEVSGLAPGNYRLYLAADGYVSEYYADTYDYLGARMVLVVSGATTTDVDAGLAVGAHITGTITDEGTGAPIVGAEISAKRDVCCGGGFATTGTGGSYDIAGLPPGNYSVQIGALGYAPEYYDNTYDNDAAAFVAVAPGGTVGGIDAALSQGGSLTGVVRDEFGAPLAGATVSATRTVCCHTAFATTLADGSYVFSGLPPGEYIIRASATGYVYEYYDNAFLISSALAVPVTIGATASGIDFALAREAGSAARSRTRRRASRWLAYGCTRRSTAAARSPEEQAVLRTVRTRSMACRREAIV
jgi:hypothetical protein